MARLKVQILDERYSGFSWHWDDRSPRVVPVRYRYKWRFWRKPFSGWAVVQPRREVFGSSVDFVWRPVACFLERDEATAFLASMESA